MFDLARLATATPDPARPGRSVPKSYQVAGVLGLLLALWVGWSSGPTWAASPTRGRADTPAPAYPLYAWGYNPDGQLGTGNNTASTTPLLVSLPAGVTPSAIAVGFFHNLAIGSDSKLYAWGNNSDGQLGTGSPVDNNPNPTPAVVSLPAGVAPTVIAAGADHSLAIGNDGKLYAWGYGLLGELGNGMTSNSATPVVVNLPAGTTPVAIAAGFYHSLALSSDGNLYAWGYNIFGELGTTDPNAIISTPVTVSLPGGVRPIAIAAGIYQSLAIGNDGKLYAWGYNNEGELGNGTTTQSNTPVLVNLPAGVTPTAIAAGGQHSLAIGNDGKLYAWGYNGFGQVGIGTNNNITTPAVVSLPAGVRPTAIATGFNHSLAAGSDGKLYAWGYNGYGQLGNGTYNNSALPVAIGSVAGVAHPLLAGGYYHSLSVLVIASQIAATDGSNQSAAIGRPFAAPLVATVRDVANNPVSSVTVTFTAPVSGTSGTFAGGSPVYTGTTDASGQVTATTFTANTSIGSYSVTATVSGVITPATFSLTNLACQSLSVTSNQDDGSCGTLRTALSFASTNPTKTVTINLAAGSTINLTNGLTLTNGVAISTTAPCGIGAGNIMLPPVIIQGVGASSGVGLTLSGNNQLYGLWVRGFSGMQIKAPPLSSTKMQCVRVSKL